MSNNIDTKDTLFKIIELETIAKQILELKKQFHQRRPIVIEFCGSPKAGKTSSINSLNIFLKRNGFKTAILTERASVCPIENKRNPIFNIWTLCSAINGMNERLYSYADKVDIVISDRGIFDSLCWFEWLCTKKYMKKKDFETVFQFATFEKWLKCIDLVYVFTADPEVSIAREYANLLTRNEGTIMNRQTLSEYRDAIEKVNQSYGYLFHNVRKIDTSKSTQNEVGYEVTSTTLETLKDLLMEKIGYTSRDIEKSLHYGINNFTSIAEKLNDIHYGNRELIESSENIQPIPIAVITNQNKDRVLLVKKTDKSTPGKSPERGKDLLYIGGHIRAEDYTNNCKDNFINLAVSALEREINEEVGISVSFDNINPFIIYTPSNSLCRHIAICFVLEIDIENTKFRFDTYELLPKSNAGKSGKPIALKDIDINKFSFESWSIEILKTVFSKDINRPDVIQQSLFDL